MSPVALDAAYAECERITTAEAKNFAWGIKLLPTPKRRALSAVYAFARRIDDIGDGDLPADQKLADLATAREQIRADAPPADDPVLVALFDAARHFPIPLDAFEELVHGCELDVRGTRYRTFAETLGYCRDVAGSIGRLSLGVFAPPQLLGDGADADRERASGHADTLGLALQITNILRDVREDLGNGRVYLPQDDLDLFGCTLQLRPDGTLDPQDGALAEVVRFEAARAAGLYDEGFRLLPMLDHRSRACCAAMAGIYRELLTRLAENPQQMMTGRASLPTGTKLRIAGKALLP
ncbi:phytoene/squalene synthase family protein [Jatrophihabitans sp. YIM 134969]